MALPLHASRVHCCTARKLRPRCRWILHFEFPLYWPTEKRVGKVQSQKPCPSSRDALPMYARVRKGAYLNVHIAIRADKIAAVFQAPFEFDDDLLAHQLGEKGLGGERCKASHCPGCPWGSWLAERERRRWEKASGAVSTGWGAPMVPVVAVLVVVAARQRRFAPTVVACGRRCTRESEETAPSGGRNCTAGRRGMGRGGDGGARWLAGGRAFRVGHVPHPRLLGAARGRTAQRRRPCSRPHPASGSERCERHHQLQ